MIRLEGVSKGFAGGSNAVLDLSLDIPDGQKARVRRASPAGPPPGVSGAICRRLEGARSGDGRDKPGLIASSLS